MDSTDFDIEKILRPKGELYEMEIIGDHLFSGAVPYDAPEELKKNVLAALKAFTLGNKSIDYTRKNTHLFGI